MGGAVYYAGAALWGATEVQQSREIRRAPEAAFAWTSSYGPSTLFVRTEAQMRKKLTRTGNSLAVLLDKELLERLGIDADTQLEISTDGRVVIISPVRTPKREQKLRATMDRAHQRYAGVFRKLAK